MKHLIYYLLLAAFFVQPARTEAQLVAIDITWDSLKTVFNADQDKPRILSVLGVNCPPCRVHRDDIRNQVMNQCDNPDLRWIILWFEDPAHPAVRADAESQALLVTDSRATQFWFKEHQPTTAKNDSIARYLGASSWMGCSYAWDISMLFDGGSVWNSEPPSPDYCMARISGCCNFYNIINFKNAIDNLGVCDADTTTGLMELHELPLLIIPDYKGQVLRIRFEYGVSNAQVFITDVAGRIVIMQSDTGSGSEIIINLADGNLAAGVYLVEVRTGDLRLSSKFWWQ